MSISQGNAIHQVTGVPMEVDAAWLAIAQEGCNANKIPCMGKDDMLKHMNRRSIPFAYAACIQTGKLGWLILLT